MSFDGINMAQNVIKYTAPLDLLVDKQYDRVVVML